MAETISFSIARKGYDCGEVDNYISAFFDSMNQLRESYSQLQTQYDSLFDSNSKLVKENARLKSDCTALALAIKKQRENAESTETPAPSTEHVEVISEGDGNQQAQLEQLKAENKAYAQEIEQLKALLAEKERIQASSDGEYGETASKMISEVAAVVQKLEKDARRKAEAITVSAKLEQERANIIKERVNQEVESLMTMLESFLNQTKEEGSAK